jgi:hypothetical protein
MCKIVYEHILCTDGVSPTCVNHAVPLRKQLLPEFSSKCKDVPVGKEFCDDPVVENLGRDNYTKQRNVPMWGSMTPMRRRCRACDRFLTELEDKAENFHDNVKKEDEDDGP